MTLTTVFCEDLSNIVQTVDMINYALDNYERVAATLSPVDKEFISDLVAVVNTYRENKKAVSANECVI